MSENYALYFFQAKSVSFYVSCFVFDFILDFVFSIKNNSCKNLSVIYLIEADLMRIHIARLCKG